VVRWSDVQAVEDEFDRGPILNSNQATRMLVVYDGNRRRLASPQVINPAAEKGPPASASSSARPWTTACATPTTNALVARHES
jgi:hypothetical protein